MEHLYYCSACKSFSKGIVFHKYYKCLRCGNCNLKELTLTDDDYIVLREIDNSEDFILSMNKLKQGDNANFNLKLAKYKQSINQ